MNRKHVFSIGEFYHIYNRGSDKRIIFNDSHDYERFIKLLYICNSSQVVNLRDLFHKGETFVNIFDIGRAKPLVSIGAWCLMPNHFHLLLKEVTENGISKFMQKLTTAYTMYFNKKYTRVGSLLQGVFKSEHITEDRYLKYLFSYIHLNPIKLISSESKWKEVGIKDIKKVEDFLENYTYSSYRDCMKKETSYLNIIDEKEFPNYFLNTKEAAEEVQEWLNFSDSRVTKVKPL